MPTTMDKHPNFRISDVEELIRETGMDNSETGVQIVNYFRRKHEFQRGRLFDGSDNQINIRLDNLQPVELPAPSSNDNAENSNANAADQSPVGVVLVRPLAELTMAENRVPSFVSPGRVATVNSPPRVSSRPLTSIVSSPPGRSTVHVSPRIAIPANKSSVNNLQREIVLQRQKRENQMKMEMLRNNASQLASSTPIAGDHSVRRGENLLDLRETISPIHEDGEQGTPARVLRKLNAEHVMPKPSTTNARAIGTPIPATQDALDGMGQNDRETTPPRSPNGNRVVVIPETPSPVRTSPRVPCTPLSGLSLAQRTSRLAVPGLSQLGKGKSIQGIRSPASSTPSRSILKKRESRFASPRNRVSFSEQLCAVREMTPSSDVSNMTSDEDDELEQDNADIANSRVNPVEQENAKHPRRLFGSRRSNAIDECDENVLHDSPKRYNNRTNGNTVNMILEDWNEPASERMEVDEPQENRELSEAHRTINNSQAITNIDTPRTVMMEVFDPPSAFCDDVEQEEQEETNDLNMEETAPEAPTIAPSGSPSRKRKKKGNDHDREGSPGRNENENNDHEPIGLSPKISKPSLNATVTNLQTAERIVSVNSPNDRVSLDMLQVVDMIHSRVNSELVDTGDANERRTTLNIPPKRRHTKSKLSAETELYLKTIDDACSRKKATNKKRKDRRKLFTPEITEAQRETEDNDEPQPLPPTQDDCPETAVQLNDQEYYGIKPLIVPVHRLSINTINRAINANTADVENPDMAKQSTEPSVAIESPIQEKQNEEGNEKGDRPKGTDSDGRDDFMDTQRDRRRRPGKGKSNRERRDDVKEIEQKDPAKVKPHRDQHDDAMETKQKGSSKGKTHSAKHVDFEDRVQEKPAKGKSHRNKRNDVTDKRVQNDPADGETHSDQLEDAVDMMQNDPVEDNSSHEQHDDVRNTLQKDPAQKASGKSKSTREHRDDVMDTDPSKTKSKSKSSKNKKQPRESNVMFEKYLKNVSNEIRHQIESEGPRRSHRNRRLAAEVLRNNPNTLQTDAPKYVMPTINDVLQYYQQSSKPRSEKSKSKSSKTAANKKQTEKVEKPKEGSLPTVREENAEMVIGEKKRSRGRPKKHAKGEKETFDDDGFRVPPIPMDDAIPGPSSQTLDASIPSPPQGVSIDSGLSSAVMTGDDATTTAAAPATMKKREKSSSKKQTAVAQPEPSCSYKSQPAPSVVRAEKRKTLDWMMKLMENRDHYSTDFPYVGTHGFTHLTVEHLAFEQKDGIEYSFYVYSNGDNFGFLRFPPGTGKKTTRTKQCTLKFLVLSGTQQFTINETTISVAGGDFLMIPCDSSYSIANGSDTSLMFMIKNSQNPVLRKTTKTVGVK